MNLFKSSLLSTLLSIAALSSQAALTQSYDLSGNDLDGTGSNNGIVTGATLTTDRYGNANSAYLFNGSDSIQANLVSSPSMSFSMWATSISFENNPMLFNTSSYGTGPDQFFAGTACGPSISWNTWGSCDNNF